MRILILLLSFLFSGILISQELPYSFYLSSQEFEALNDGTPLNDGEVWDQNSNFPLTFSFDFKVKDQNYSNINVRAGGIDFVGPGTKRLNVFFSPFGGAIIKDKGETESLSPISYKEDVIDGNKVLKIEWQNAGFKATPSDTGDEDDFVTYQVWLIENINLIKIVYGPSQSTLGTYGDSGSAQGPFTKLSINNTTITPTGAADNPSYSFEDCSLPCYGHITGTPSEGIVYNFALDMTSNPITYRVPELVLYPNVLQNGQIHLEAYYGFDFQNHTIHFFDSNGSKIPFDYSGSLSFDVSHFAAGVYFVIIRDSKGTIVLKEQILKTN